MNNTPKRNIMMIIATLTLLSNVSPANASYYPNLGDLYYDGRHYLDSVFRWYSPGPWAEQSVRGPGYEHDLAILPSYFRHCTSFTDLPSGYNDCPTAGWSEGGEQWVFSFGSFDATQIRHTFYWGAWQFDLHGPTARSPFSLSGQHVYHKACAFNNIWCMAGVPRNKIMLVSGYMNWLGSPTQVVFQR